MADDLKLSLSTTGPGNERSHSNEGFSPPQKKLRPHNTAASMRSRMLPDDGHQWHKYGHKTLVDTAFSRAYYRCAQKAQGCQAKKTVDFPVDPSSELRITYDGVHNHESTSVMFRTSHVVVCHKGAQGHTHTSVVSTFQPADVAHPSGPPSDHQRLPGSAPSDPEALPAGPGILAPRMSGGLEPLPRQSQALGAAVLDAQHSQPPQMSKVEQEDAERLHGTMTSPQGHLHHRVLGLAAAMQGATQQVPVVVSQLAATLGVKGGQPVQLLLQLQQQISDKAQGQQVQVQQHQQRQHLGQSAIEPQQQQQQHQQQLLWQGLLQQHQLQQLQEMQVQQRQQLNLQQQGQGAGPSALGPAATVQDPQHSNHLKQEAQDESPGAPSKERRLPTQRDTQAEAPHPKDGKQQKARPLDLNLHL